MNLFFKYLQIEIQAKQEKTFIPLKKSYSGSDTRPSISFLKKMAFLFLGICLFMPCKNFSQALEFKRYGIAQGLTQGFIYTMIQDNAGFIWFGTGKGLFRFDGSKFKAFGQRDGLAEDFVTSSYLDKSGNIWFGHYLGGITIYKDGLFTKLNTAELFTSSITSITEDDWGNIWVASQGEGLIKIDRQKKIFAYPDIGKGLLIHSMQYAGKARLLIGTNEGLFVYRLKSSAESPELSHEVSAIPKTKIQSISLSIITNGFWIVTEDEGIFLFLPGLISQNDVVSAYNSKNGFPEENNTGLLEEPNGNLCIGTNGWSALWFHPIDSKGGYSEIKNLTKSDSLSKENIKCLFQDRFGQIWLGTFGQGVICVTRPGFSLYESLNQNQNYSFSKIMEDHENNFWIGSDQGLLLAEAKDFPDKPTSFHFGNRIGFEESRVFTTKEGLSDNNVKALLEFPIGTLWIGTNNSGLCKMDLSTRKISKVNLGAIDLSNFINDLDHDKEGNIWAATRGGAFRLNPNTEKIDFFTTENGLPHNFITDLFLDSKKVLWFATHSHRAAYFTGSDFKTVGIEAENVLPDINCITEDNNGNMWFGTDGAGVSRFDGKNFENFTTEENLLSDFVYIIFVDKQNTIWAGHRNGLSRIIPKTKKVIQYSEKDAFPVKNISISNCSGDGKGNIWFSTYAGLLRFFPQNEDEINKAPFTLITSFQVFDEDKPLIGNLELPYEKYRIKFEFLGLTLLNQGDVRYQYMLEGNDIDWSDVTASTEVTYQGLAHGDYTFLVRASNRYGLWNDKPVSFSFSISPPFWLTWWFWLLMGLGIILLLYLFIRYRIYRFRKEKELLEEKINERTIELRLEKEKLEKAYQEIQKLSLAVSETSNAILILDENGYLEWVNKGLTRMTGYSLEELKKMTNGKKFLESSSNEKINTLLVEAIANNKPVSYESVVPKKDGGQLYVLSTLTPILDENGKLLNIAIIDSDISDRKKAEQEIKQMNQNLEILVEKRTEELAVANDQLKIENIEHIKTADQLKLINQELDTFIYRASHDLKGPLASLIGLVGLSREQVKDEGALRYIDLMERSAVRLDDILLNLLEATSIRQTKPEISKVNLKSLVETVFETIRAKSDSKGLSLENAVPDGLELNTDAKLLSTALQNMVDNSVKFQDPAKSGVQVQIVAVKSGTTNTITVSDNGKGIHVEQIDKVFDMFYRGENQIKGTGLGLYIVKNIVSKLHGTIRLQSEYGKGTRLVMELPDEVA